MSTRTTTTDHETLAEYVRFRRALLFLLAGGLLFCAGQAVRLGFNLMQVREITARNTEMYVSALGPDIGDEPFGRLQFEYGKLVSTKGKGLDPLSVLALLSSPATPDLRVDSLEIHGTTGVARGFFGPEADGLDAYVKGLEDNLDYAVTLSERQETVGGIEFALTVTKR